MQEQIEKELIKAQKAIEEKQSQISFDSVKEQYLLLLNGARIPELVRPCTIDDGIIRLDSSEYSELLSKHKVAAAEGRLMKFVPASGAASRMFQKLEAFVNSGDSISFEEIKNLSGKNSNYQFIVNFLNNLNSFAFYDNLKELLLNKGFEIEKLKHQNPVALLRYLLYDEGLNYAQKPKGAIKFHKYEHGHRDAFTEQLIECIDYIKDAKNIVRIHFTISEEHKELFIEFLSAVDKKFNNAAVKPEIDYSFQSKSTDTIAVDLQNKIIYDEKDNLLLRPGGHGALLKNLNDLKADVIFIKNIDNLVHEKYSGETKLWKKILAGYLIKIQKEIFICLNDLDDNEIAEQKINEIAVYAEKLTGIKIPSNFNSFSKDDKVKFLTAKLNKPIRICGMVKNEGEPGGGPFWVKNSSGEIKPQIIEQAQIDSYDPDQKNIFKSSTHFNPVDLVCGVRDYKGNNFDLSKFRDIKSAIITQKSKAGEKIKVLELPGLWNGGMADWITIFIEVPISTFNPVKEINDLLKPLHNQ